MRLPWVSRAAFEDVVRQRDSSDLRVQIFGTRADIDAAEIRAWKARAEAASAHLLALQAQVQADGKRAQDDLRICRDDVKYARELLIQRRAEDTAHLEAAEKRFDGLLSRFTMLKLQGFTEAAAQPVAGPAPVLDPITEAINAACAGKDAKVRVGMVKQVARDKKADLSVDEIVQRIQRGNRPAEEVE